MDQNAKQDYYKKVIDEFGLGALPEHERDEMIPTIAETIQKQFLFAVQKSVTKEQFDALEASASMGTEFYATTLKHVVPNYDELFQNARMKVMKMVLAELAKGTA